MKTGSDFLRSLGIEGAGREHGIHGDSDRAGGQNEGTIGVGWQPEAGDDGPPAADAARGQQAEEREAPSREVGLTQSGRSGDSGQFGERTPPRARFAEFMAHGLAAEQRRAPDMTTASANPRLRSMADLPPTGTRTELLAATAAKVPASGNTSASGPERPSTDQIVSPAQVPEPGFAEAAPLVQTSGRPISIAADAAPDAASATPEPAAVPPLLAFSASVGGDWVMAADGTRADQAKSPALLQADPHSEARPSRRAAVGLEVLREMFVDLGAASLGYASVEYDGARAPQAALTTATEAPGSGGGAALAPVTPKPQVTSQPTSASLATPDSGTATLAATSSSIADPGFPIRVQQDSSWSGPPAATAELNVPTEARVSELIQQLTAEHPRSASVAGQVHRRKVAEDQQGGGEAAASGRSGPAPADSAARPLREADGRSDAPQGISELARRAVPARPAPLAVPAAGAVQPASNIEGTSAAQAPQSQPAEQAAPPVVSEPIDLEVGVREVSAFGGSDGTALGAPDVSASTASHLAGGAFDAHHAAAQIHRAGATLSRTTLVAASREEQSTPLAADAAVVNERSVTSTDVRTPGIEVPAAVPAPPPAAAAKEVFAAEGAIAADASNIAPARIRPSVQQDRVASQDAVASQVALPGVHVPWREPSDFASPASPRLHARPDTRASFSSTAGGGGDPAADAARATSTGSNSAAAPNTPDQEGSSRVAVSPVPVPFSPPALPVAAGSRDIAEQAPAPATNGQSAPSPLLPTSGVAEPAPAPAAEMSAPSVPATAGTPTVMKQQAPMALSSRTPEGTVGVAAQPAFDTGTVAARPSRPAVNDGKQSPAGALPSPMLAAGPVPAGSPSGTPAAEQQSQHEAPSGRSPRPKAEMGEGRPSALLVERPAGEPPLPSFISVPTAVPISVPISVPTSVPTSVAIAGDRRSSPVQPAGLPTPTPEAPVGAEGRHPMEAREERQSPLRGHKNNTATASATETAASAPEATRPPRSARAAVPPALPDGVIAAAAAPPSASAPASGLASASPPGVPPTPTSGLAPTAAPVTTTVRLGTPNAPVAVTGRPRSEMPPQQVASASPPLTKPKQEGQAADAPAHPIAPGIPPVRTIHSALVGRVAETSTHQSVAAAASLAVSSSDPAPIPASQPRRVRAAVLELQHRLLDQLLPSGNAAPAPADSPTSRYGIDTAPGLDKGNQKKLFAPSSSSAEEKPAAIAAGWALPIAQPSTAPFTPAGSPAPLNPPRRSKVAGVEAAPDQRGGSTEPAASATPSSAAIPQVSLAAANAVPAAAFAPPVAAVASALGSSTATPTGAPPPQHASLANVASELLAAAALHLATRSVAQPPSRATVPAVSSPPAHPLQPGHALQSSPPGFSAQGDLPGRGSSTGEPGLGSSSSSSSAAAERKREQASVAPQLETPRATPAAVERSLADLQGMQMVAAPAAAAPFTLSDPRPAGSSEPHPAAPAPAHPLLELAAADPSLNASALGKNAHVRLETKSDGDLSLHLMVHDGVVDVRFDGAAAHKLDLRPSEVRAALAGEGIAMGSFETSRSSSSQAVNQPNSTSSSGSQFGSNSNSNSNSNSSSFQSNSDSPGSSGGGASSAHTGAGTGSGFGSGTRNPDGGDRWANSGPEAGSHRPSDGASRSSPHGTSKSSDADQPPRRRGFHVTA